MRTNRYIRLNVGFALSLVGLLGVIIAWNYEDHQIGARIDVALWNLKVAAEKHGYQVHPKAFEGTAVVFGYEDADVALALSLPEGSALFAVVASDPDAASEHLSKKVAERGAPLGCMVSILQTLGRSPSNKVYGGTVGKKLWAKMLGGSRPTPHQDKMFCVTCKSK
jgi:hypothetical protein